jgi:hypothetical protein
VSNAGKPGSLLSRSAALAALFFVVACSSFGPEVIVSPPASTSVAAPRPTAVDVRPSLDSPSAPTGASAAGGPPAVFTADTPVPPRPAAAAAASVEERGSARQECIRACNRDNDRCSDSYSSRRSADAMVGGAGLIGSGVDLSGSAGCSGSLSRCLSRCNTL